VSKSFDETDTRARAFGERLRRERELRGISLDEIAAATKIGTRLLRALEDEQFDLLPGGIFNKGYVRAYARHLGIDDEQAVADYLKAANETPPDLNLIARQGASARTVYITSNVSYRNGFRLVPVLILLLVIVGGAGAWHLYQQRQRERRQPYATNSASTPTRSAPAVPQSENAGVSQVSPSNAAVHTVEAAESSPQQSASISTGSAAEASAPFEITVRAKDRAWIEIKSDGKILLQGVMNPTDVKTIHATNKVVFWTGNAGVVELSFNGKNVPLNGGENDEQVLVFNSHGLLPRPATQ
jgi:cytoskeleton protein RodZ